MKLAVAFCLLGIAVCLWGLPMPNPQESAESDGEERKKSTEELENYGTTKRGSGGMRESNDEERKKSTEELENFGTAGKRAVAVPEYKRDSASGDSAQCQDSTVKLWPGSTVKYAFCGDITDKTNINTAIAKLRTQLGSAITFEDVTGNDGVDCDSPDPNDHYIAIRGDKTGCWSYIGYITSMPAQTLSVPSTGCNSVAVIMHEFTHAIGQYHQQQRSDQAQHVTINEDNIKSGYVDQFSVRTSICTNCPYQTCSLMHYKSNTFAMDRSKNTITPSKIDEKAVMGGDTAALSPGDICAIVQMYDKEQECPNVHCKYGSGKYHNYCCMCVNDLSGDDCGTLPANSDTWNTYSLSESKTEVTFSSPSQNNKYPKNTDIHYFTTAPEGRKIALNCPSFSVEPDSTCHYDYFDVYLGDSILDCPSQFCGTKTISNLQSDSNFLYIIFHSDDMYQYAGFTCTVTLI